MLTPGIVTYFKEIHDVDVSSITIVDTTIGDGDKGEYKLESPNTIFIDSNACSRPFLLHVTLVHEIAHMLQYERGISLSLQLDRCEDGVLMDALYHKRREWAVSWGNRPLEIDAILNEAYYIYYLNNSRDFYDACVEYLIKRFKNTTDMALLRDIISRIKAPVLKELALDVLQ